MKTENNDFYCKIITIMCHLLYLFIRDGYKSIDLTRTLIYPLHNIWLYLAQYVSDMTSILSMNEWAFMRALSTHFSRCKMEKFNLPFDLLECKRGFFMLQFWHRYIYLKFESNFLTNRIFENYDSKRQCFSLEFFINFVHTLHISFPTQRLSFNIIGL